MSVHFSFNKLDVSVLHTFLEQLLDAHGHRIPSKLEEQRGEEEETEMKSIFFGGDGTEIKL